MTSSSTKIFKIFAPLKFLNRDLKLIFACNLVGSFGDGLYAYTLPKYLTGRLGANSVELGILYAVMSLIAAITLFTAGMLADKYDRKKIMIAGWIAWIPAPIIFSFAKNWVHALPGMFLWGFWLGGPTTTAYVVTSADKSRLSSSFMAISAAWSLGYIFSPGIGGYLAEIFGYTLVFYSAAFLYVLATIILAFTSSQKATPNKIGSPQEEVLPLRKLIRFRKLLVFSAFFALVMFTIMLFRPFVPSFLSDIYHYQEFEIGIFGSISFFGSACPRSAFGKNLRQMEKSLRARHFAGSLQRFGCPTFAVWQLLRSNNCFLPNWRLIHDMVPNERNHWTDSSGIKQSQMGGNSTDYKHVCFGFGALHWRFSILNFAVLPIRYSHNRLVFVSRACIVAI